jgi:hypothetical protein
VIPARFDFAANFSAGLAPVQIDRKWGYITPSGKVAIARRFDNAAVFVEGLARVQVGNKWGYLNRQDVAATLG